VLVQRLLEQARVLVLARAAHKQRPVQSWRQSPLI
jgi:hypothetical protein